MTFEKYVDAAAVSVLLEAPLGPQSPDHHPLLNGAPYQAFRRAVDLKERRLAGAFFSGPVIASKLAAELRAVVADDALVMDPTCGMGDLLLAYASLLPIKKTLDATLRSWGERLAGMDLRSDLVRMTKVRLVVLARARGQFTDAISTVDAYFPKIVMGNMLKSDGLLHGIDGFLFNPPFGRTSTPEGVDWSSGQTNAAAIFLSKLLDCRKKQAVIAAVLPEVLRCGSNYARFRRHLRELGVAGSYESAGQFDTWTDVDVFITVISGNKGEKIWFSSLQEIEQSTVGKLFNIRVGAVVPHRDPKLGTWKPYICAKTTPTWVEAFAAQNNRRFRGTTFKPPFVVIRRTSSPSDKLRATGTIIVGEKNVAVENHLLVLSPISEKIETCLRLLRVLKHIKTSEYLNIVIRCQHLTTKSVASIPWLECDD